MQHKHEINFSIVTPSYNQAGFLGTTIESVRNQSYCAFEHIVVDGGSTDGSVELINKYRSTLSKIIIENDEGQADAINKGFAHSAGDIFAYLNSDDYYFTNTLEIVADYFMRHPCVDMVYGDCVFTDGEGQFIRYFSEISDFNKDRLLNYSDIIMQPTAFWRRRVFDKYGPFDKHLHYVFDWAFWCELASKGCNIQRIPYTLAANRVYPQTKTLSGSKDRLKEIKLINRRYRTRSLLHAYYRFYLADIVEKGHRVPSDYIKFPFLILLSYGNIIHHFTHYSDKIIHGFMPKSHCIRQRAEIRMPNVGYRMLCIGFSTPADVQQSVDIYRSGEWLSHHEFRDSVLELEIPLDPGRDIDICMEFERVYPRHSTIAGKIIYAYQPNEIAATMTLLRMR